MESSEWDDSVVLLDNPKPARRLRVSFGVFLAAIVTVGTVGGAVAVGALLYTAIQRGNVVLATDLQKVTQDNVAKLLVQVASVPTGNLLTLGFTLGFEAEQNASFLRSEQARRILFAHSLALYDGVSLGLPSGELLGYRGNVLVPLQYIESVHTSNGTITLNIYHTDMSKRDGLPLGPPLSITPNFNATSVVWYSLAAVAMRSTSIVWTGLRILLNCNCLGITASRAVYAGDQLVGVAATNVRMDTLSQALNGTKVGNAVEVFLVDGNGNLVGLSNPVRLNVSFDRLTHYTEIQDPLFRSLIAYLTIPSGHPVRGPPSNFSLNRNIPSETATLNGAAYLLTTFSMDLSADLNMTVIIVIPRDDYFAVSDLAVTQALIIGVFIAFAVLVVTIVVSLLLLTVPLRRLAIGMNEVATSLAPPTLSRNSFISEVDAMEHAYTNMASGIFNFSKYVPGPVVQQLLAVGSRPTVSVASRVCTFFFSDIVGFTSISEELTTAQLNVLISEYFDAMERILYDLHGITTDFLGDGIFVFWNAPSLDDNHALLACEAALRQQTALRRLGADWASRGLPRMAVRIGVNTGPCLVGNFGSTNHLKYTVIGDAVNVAARLEQVNKLYDTSVLIGSATHELVKANFVCRAVDVVVLKGKSEATTLYELLARAEEASKEQLQLRDAAARMLDHFLASRFEQAIAVANEILLYFPGDRPAVLMREHCVELRRGFDGGSIARKLSEK
jgi:class 3 adenylate cyclase